MAKFTDLLDPLHVTQRAIDVVKAPFEGRGNAPWAQATARNIGHAAFGDMIGNYVDQHLLGDTPVNGQLQWKAPAGTTPEMMNMESATKGKDFGQLLLAFLGR